jgi:hypothetical protein
MIEKARQAAAFLFWCSQTSLPEVRFVLTLHAWTKLSFSLSNHVFVFSLLLFSLKKKKKGGGRKMQIFIPYLAFQISYVFLPDVSVPGALILLLLYN